MSGRQNNLVAQALQQGSLALRMRQFGRAEQIATEILKSNRTEREAVLLLALALIDQNRARRSHCAASKELRAAAATRKSRPCLAHHSAVLGARRMGSSNYGVPLRGVHRICPLFRNSQVSLPKPENSMKLSGPSKMVLLWRPRT